MGHPDFGRALPCQCTLQQWEKEKRQRLARYSNLGPLSRLTFEALATQGRPPGFLKALEDARTFAQEPQGWLVLVGPAGSGKTSLAAAIANYRLDLGYPALFVSLVDLLDHLRSSFSPQSAAPYDQLLEGVRQAPLLLVDELAEGASTPWAQEKLHQLVSRRYDGRLPTVFTTSTLELEEPLLARLTDPALSRVVRLEERGGGQWEDIGGPGLELRRRMTLDQFDRRRELPPEQRQNLEEALRLARDFAREPQGWLVFLGTNGCGKTHLATAIAQARKAQGDSVVFAFVPELLDHLRSSFSPESRLSYDELFDRVKKAPLLVLDDLGEQAATPWAREKLYQVINYRYNLRLPTIITSCRRFEEIDPRISTRMSNNDLSTVWLIVAPHYMGNPEERPSRRRPPRGRGDSPRPA